MFQRNLNKVYIKLNCENITFFYCAIAPRFVRKSDFSILHKIESTYCVTTENSIEIDIKPLCEDITFLKAFPNIISVKDIKKDIS